MSAYLIIMMAINFKMNVMNNKIAKKNEIVEFYLNKTKIYKYEWNKLAIYVELNKYIKS